MKEINTNDLWEYLHDNEKMKLSYSSGQMKKKSESKKGLEVHCG